MSITVTVSGGEIRVVAPYNAEFIARAKKIGGKWGPGAWAFDVRDESRVRELCRDVYGEDGAPVERVTLRAVFAPQYSVCRESITLAGRVVARAFGRDSGAKLGDGVVCIEGGFSSGGSMKNWDTIVGRSGATVLIRDVPASMAERVISDLPRGVVSAEIEPESDCIADVEALKNEREQLTARIAQIDEALAKASP